MSAEERLDYIIRAHLPWYISFYHSWKEASGQLEALWLTSEELFADRRAAVGRVLDFYGLKLCPSRVEAAEARDTRRNVGEVGRGRALIQGQLATVLDQAAACSPLFPLLP